MNKVTWSVRYTAPNILGASNSSSEDFVDSSPELSFICGISLCVWETSIIVSFAGSFLSLLSSSLPIDATLHGTFWPFDLVKGESRMLYCALPQYPKYRELSRLCSDNMLLPFGRENPGTGTKANCIQTICSCLVVERIPSTGTKADCAWTIRSRLAVEKIPSTGPKPTAFRLYALTFW